MRPGPGVQGLGPRTILWKFAEPQPKSSVVSPLFMEKVLTPAVASFSSSLSSIAPTCAAARGPREPRPAQGGGAKPVLCEVIEEPITRLA